MNIPEFSVRRPVFTAMFMLFIVVIGGVSLARLQIDLLPSIEMPTASIRTEYPGASPEVMERLVTQIMEEIVATVPGVEEIRSVSEEGRSSVNVTFVWGTNLDSATMDLRSTVENEINEFPDDIVRPRIAKYSIDTFPIVLIGISSPLDPVELTQLIEDRIRYRFTRIPGVAQVDLWGGFPREVRMEINPERVSALGLSLVEITTALKDANIDLPAGQIEEGRYEVSLRAPAQFANLDEIRNTVLTMRNGAPVRVGDVAEVKDTYEEQTRIIRINNEKGIRIAIRKQSSANTVEVSRQILSTIEQLNSEFPQIHIVPVINQGNFIERSIRNVAHSVLYGGGLAIVILLFFLRSFRSTLIISFSIPISIISTFALIYFAGFTINLMTLGGLALGVGMMVDSSIVVLENIFRRREECGDIPSIAASRGAQEVVPAILASTVTTVVIFLPIAFIEGISSMLFRELAYVIAFSLLCSLLVAISLVPMLTSRFWKNAVPSDNTDDASDKLKQFAKQQFSRLNNTYIRLLQFTLKRKWRFLSATLLLFIGSLFLTPFIGTEFLPPSDEGEVRIEGEMEIGTRLDLVDKQTRQMEAIVYPAVPEAVSTVVSVRQNVGQIRMSLVPASQRTRSNTEIADALRKKLQGKVAGMKIRTRAPQGQFLLERLFGGTEKINVEIRGFNLDVLHALSEEVTEAIEHVNGVTDVDSSYESNSPQQEIRIDRAKVANLGFTPKDITRAVETAIAGSRAGNFRQEGNSYRILVQLKNARQRTLSEVLNLNVKNATGQNVPLSNFVTTVSSRAPISITRKDQQRNVTVSANVSGRDLGSVAGDIEKKLRSIPKPDSFEFILGGNFEEQQKSFHQLTWALLLSLLLVFMVLAAQYESFFKPMIVMWSTPLAAIGVLFTLWATDTTLNLQSAIGCIMLGGIVVNNAILLVDQTGKLTAEGMALEEAIIEASRRRLRPILMTSLTTVLGLLPLALGIGEGADAQAPMARAVIGGLLSSTFITLIVIPLLYRVVYFKQVRRNETHS
ncbi:MAG: efflux RND transporter permease subunit [Deltaproteobacteria bacterium]|nr:efflux RND transporter permease subunit [Deltaproteobacteria bacterium]MBN2670084.1 efflux RND transporter permease subunit [Deltaproteobacteria bacterium]